MPKQKPKKSGLEESFEKLMTKITRVPAVQKIFWLDHLRTMIHASLSLVEALGILEKEITNRKLRDATARIKNEVEKGRALSEVLSEFPKIFPPMYVKMISSGELSGRLDESLSQVVMQMKKNQELVSSVRGAMIYPSVIVLTMGVVGIVMTTTVLPKLIEIFNEFDADLPLATQILIKITNFMSNPLYLTLIIVGIVSLFFGYLTLIKKVKPFRSFIHAVILKIPIFGPVAKQINLARFSLTLSSLLESTIPIIEAVEITADTCSNVHFQKALHGAAKEIKSGRQLSELLAEKNKLFPPMVTEMIMVGERTGEVDRLLKELADFYAGEVDKTMKNFTTIIEPVVILFMGVVVAGVAVAIVMPIYNLSQNF